MPGRCCAGGFSSAQIGGANRSPMLPYPPPSAPLRTVPLLLAGFLARQLLFLGLILAASLKASVITPLYRQEN